MTLTKKQKQKINESLKQLEILLYIGNLDFLGLKSKEGFQVSETITNRLETPLKNLKELIEE